MVEQIAGVQAVARSIDKTERLSLGSKLAFGAGELAPSLVATVLAFFQLFFLTTVAGLNPAAAGSILLIVKIWDAITDPIVGWLSDRTRSRLGRRRPWILYGTLPLAITFVLQWLVPPFAGTERFFYYLVAAMLFSLAFTVVSIPYNALAPALSRDYDEGTSLTAFRSAFSIGASMLAGALHQGVVNAFGDVQVGYMAAAIVWGLCCVPPLLWCFLGTRERYQGDAKEQAMPIAAQLRAVAHNKPYLVVVGLYLCSWLSVQMTSTVLIFYITYWFQTPTLIVPMLLSVQIASFIFLFGWNAASRWMGKRAVYITGILFLLLVQVALFFVPSDRPMVALALVALGGVGVAVAYLIPWSMMPDVIAYDELINGKRREGMFYGLMILAQKLGLALALFAVGLALQLQGFDQTLAPGQQSAPALFAIRLLVGPIPAAVVAVGLVLATMYPITRAKHVEMMAQLQERRMGREA